MISYIIKRVLLLIPVLLVVSTIVFFLIHIIPGDPVDFILGEQALPVDRELLIHEFELDRPVSVQYLHFMKGVLKGDLKHSLLDRRSVARHIQERYGATLQLAVAALFVALIIAIPLGIFAALKKNSIYDSSAMFLSLVGISMPNFWLGPLLILLFCVTLGWFPVAGRESLSSIVLPAVTLGAALSAMLSRMTRASMLEVLNKEYITAARAKGLPESKVILKHALKNALNPILTIVGLQVGALLAGAIVTEKIFN
ncbi:MAG: ABC transporter permease, partial [Deltaproteobacteria bacterium]|nr:ABC transporter permease [Deltaproteobacteria bacterium]